MNCNIAGTARVTVIFSSPKTSQIFTGSNSLMIVAVPPRLMIDSIGLSAPTWNSGRQIR